MIYTSYFAKMRKMPSTFHPISIAQYPPKGVEVPSCKALAPSKKTLFDYKNAVDKDGSASSVEAAKERYTESFGKEVLSHGSEWILQKIWDSLPPHVRQSFEITNCAFWDNPNEHVVLCCFEKSGDFCHRHLIAEALAKDGVRVEEATDTDFENEKKRLEDISAMYKEIVERNEEREER